MNRSAWAAILAGVASILAVAAKVLSDLTF